MPTISLPLTVRDLREADLVSCSWAGTDLHLRSVAAELGRVALKVEEGNPRARALYERLGYRVRGREPDAWDVEGPDGGVVRYETTCLLMGKDLR